YAPSGITFPTVRRFISIRETHPSSTQRGMPRTVSIKLPHALLHDLLDRARTADHVEICGFIAQSERTFSVYSIDNIARHPDRHFAMAPTDQLAAFGHMQRAGEALIAIYHSHPEGQAVPSAADQHNHH